MARRAARPCAQAGCPALVLDPGQRYCPVHLRIYRQKQDEQRGSSAERGYGMRWRDVRDRYLKGHPTCERCGRNKAEVVHHIVPKRQGGSDDPINLQALCTLCHAQVHAKLGTLFGASPYG